MPQPHKINPDWIDVENLCATLAGEFAVTTIFTTRIRGGRVEVIGKTHGSPFDGQAQVVHVALVSFEVKRPRDMAVVCYTLAFDLWCQHDGGGATAAARGAPHGWDGRVEVPTGARKR